jgi:hypothetical protein
MARLTGYCSTTFLVLLASVQTGCSATHRVYPDDDAGETSAGGALSTGGSTATGGASSIGGASSTGAASSLGGSSAAGGGFSGGLSSAGGTSASTGASLGGAAATGGTAATTNASLGGASAGGAAAAGGAATAAGGTSAIASSATVTAGSTSVSTGGANAGTGGASPATGGASACSKATDCTNTDPINCSYTCENPGASGICKPAALVGPTQCITADCPVKPISGFWDADGKPHIAYGWTESDGTASIRMQQVGLDGTQVGAAVAYPLPAQQQEPDLVSANTQGSHIAFLWETVVQVPSTGVSADYGVTDFAITDGTGVRTTPTQVEQFSPQSPVRTAQLWLQLTPAGSWLALGILQPANPAFWQATIGSTIAGWSGLSPRIFNGEFAFGVVGSTLMLTGSDCSPTSSGCQPSFKLQRYSAVNLSSIGSFIALSQNAQGNWPAMGPVNGAMALLWTETESPGQLFRALIKEDGTFGLAVGTVQSAIQPKAIVESADRRALLIGTIAGGSPVSYRVVAQRLDASLGLIGSPLPVADGETDDATGFETRLSADGSQVLVTYTQVGARYRVMSTNFCR